MEAQGANIANIGDGAVQTNYFVSVTTRNSRFWTEAFAPPSPLAGDEATRLGLSAFLTARFQVVPYVGRARERAELADWRDGAVSRAARLLHGPGGTGKTRLAMQFAADSQRVGWAVAVAHHASEKGPEAPRAEVGARGLLLLVDYAERWPRDDLLSLLRDFACAQPDSGGRGRPLPVRVLLLARPADWWWNSLSHPLGELGFAVDEQLLVAPDAADRVTLFTVARDRFAALLGVAQPEQLHPIGSLYDSAYELILTVQMAALTVVDAARRVASAPEHPDDLSRYLLDREMAHWTTMFEKGPVVIHPTQMTRAVAIAALTGAVAYDDADSILTRAGIADTESLLGDHRLCYPPMWRDTVLQPLLPDRLAEDFLAGQLPGGRSDNDPWIARLPKRLLELADPRDPAAVSDYQRHGVIVLVEAAGRAGHITRTILDPLLQGYPALAVAAGGATLLGLAALPDIGMDTLKAVGIALPETRHADLDVAAAALSTRLLPVRLAELSDDVEGQAQTLIDHSFRLANAGRHDEALPPTEQAVAIYRELFDARPAVFERSLAESLTRLGIRLSDVGRREEAVRAQEEAIAIYRRIVETDPSADRHLAVALNSLGSELSRLERRADAFRATEEATAIYRRMARADPHALGDHLAAALNNLGNRLLLLGRLEDAFLATAEATGIYRRLAIADPSVFGPELAISLHNLANGMSRQGRHDEALARAEEAVDIYRRLAMANPAAFEPDLADSLINLGAQLSGMRRRGDAVARIAEAVDIYRRLVRTNPVAFENRLAGALNDLSVGLAAEGRDDEALQHIFEAIDIRIRLTAADPATYQADLASSFHSVGAQLAAVGRFNDALEATRVAVDIRRDLAAANPTAYEAKLAASLDRLGLSFAAVHRPDEAIDATSEAVGILRRLAATSFAAYGPDLAASLNSLGARRSENGQPEQALGAITDAVAILRELATSNPTVFEPQLARLLNNLGLEFANIRRHPEALRVSQEATDIYRGLAAKNPQVYEPELVKSLNILGARLSEVDQRRNALAAAVEAVDICRRLAAAGSADFEPDLARSLHNLGLRLSEAGRDGDAFAPTAEAVALCRVLVEADPHKFEPQLAATLYRYSRLLGAKRRVYEMQIAENEALEIYQRRFGKQNSR